MTTAIETRPIKCGGKRMGGRSGHGQISHLWWVKGEAGTEISVRGMSTREQMVEFIEKHGNQTVCHALNGT